MYGSTDITTFRTRSWPSETGGRSLSTTAKSWCVGHPTGRAASRTSRGVGAGWAVVSVMTTFLSTSVGGTAGCNDPGCTAMPRRPPDSGAVVGLPAEPRGPCGLHLRGPLALQAALWVALVAQLGGAEHVHPGIPETPHDAVAEAEALALG